MTSRSSIVSLPENRILDGLPSSDRNRILDRMTLKRFELKEVLYDAGGPISHVYFPNSGVISSVAVMVDGRGAEVAATGKEGMIGLIAAFGAEVSSDKVFCQIESDTWRMPIQVFLQEYRRGEALHELVQDYTRSVIRLTAQHAACNCLHTIEERCAKWLLMSRDRAGGDEFPLTQEFLSYMLGVRRASVTMAAGSLQKAGLITYHRGHIRIINAKTLEKVACECYQVTRGEFESRDLVVKSRRK